MQAWGWRIGFVAGALLAIVVFFIRRRLDETLSYENVAAQGGPAPRRPLANLFRDHPREAFLVMALTAGGTAAFYAYTIYLQKFLANTSGFDRATASRIMTVALALMLLLQPLAGRPVRPRRAQADDDLLRRRRDVVHLPDLHGAEPTRRASTRPSHWSWRRW